MKWSSISLPNWIIDILSPHHVFGIPLVDTHLCQIYATALCDILWFSRNQAIHKGILPDITNFVGNIKKLSLDHYATWLSISQLVRELWSTPEAGNFKVNFDTATRELFYIQVAVCRDSHGTIVHSIYQFSPLGDPDCAKAQAAFLAASLASSLKIVKFVLEGNSPLVISLLQQPSFDLDNLVTSLISRAFSLIPPPLFGRLGKSTKVQTFAFITWHIGPRLESLLVAFPLFFPPFSPPLSIPLCSGKDPPLPSSSKGGFFVCSVCCSSLFSMKQCVTKKKKKRCGLVIVGYTGVSTIPFRYQQWY